MSTGIKVNYFHVVIEMYYTIKMEKIQVENTKKKIEQVRSCENVSDFKNKL